MGYDIYAYDNKKGIITSMEAPANSFEKLKYNGYDWFGVIGAPECDGVLSGLGDEKYIQLKNLKSAFEKLKSLDKNDALKKRISGPLIDPMGIGHIVEKSIQMHVEMNLFDRIKLREKMLESQNRVVGYIIDELKEYMNSCIEWCENGNHNKVLMYFG